MTKRFTLFGVSYSINELLASVVLLVYFSSLVFPIISTLFPSSIISIGSFILWNFFAFTINRRYYSKTSVLSQLLVFLIVLIYPLIGGYSVISHRYSSMALVLCGSVILNFYRPNNLNRQLSHVILLVCGFAFVTMVITYFELLINPYVSRSIKSSGEYSSALAQRGIGGYTFIYFVAIMSIVVLYYALTTSRFKVASYAMFCFMVLFIMKANYVTAFLVVIIGTTLLFTFTIAKRQSFGLTCIAIIVVMLISLEFSFISDTIAKILPNRIASVVLNTGTSSVFQSIISEFKIDRFPVMGISIDSFLHYPLFGLLFNNGISISDGYLTGFGQHSFILDTFALYGIVGGSLCLISLFAPFKRNLSGAYAENSPLRTTMLICMIILYLVNNATESIGLVVTIIAPFVSQYLDDKKIKKSF